MFIDKKISDFFQYLTAAHSIIIPFSCLFLFLQTEGRIIKKQMSEQRDDFNSIQQDLPAQLSARELQSRRFQPRLDNKNINKKKTAPREQVTKPSKAAVKIRPTKIPVHFTWALVLTIFCFFIIGPCWALYKTIQLRRMIRREELDAAARLAHKVSTVLTISTILGIFAWVAILFCTVGLLLTGKLLVNGSI